MLVYFHFKTTSLIYFTFEHTLTLKNALLKFRLFLKFYEIFLKHK